jgi:hypothetical protein
MNPRLNALDQALDIAGSLTQTGSAVLANEPLGLGTAVSGQNGLVASISSVNGVLGTATLTGLVGAANFTNADIGSYLTISNSAANNNGTWLIVAINGTTSVDVLNPAATVDNSNLVNWTERGPYTLEDDLNFERTDRQAIKGVAYHLPVAPYYRPTATGTPVATNLSNISGKTTDALGFILNRAFYNITVGVGDGYALLSASGLLKHSDPIDKTGTPCFDAAPYAGNWSDCFATILDGYAGAEILVDAGPHAGERIFGIMFSGGSTSPDSVRMRFYSCPIGADITTSSTPYLWESGDQPTNIYAFYPYFQELDQIPENGFRTTVTLGLATDGYLFQNIDNILLTLGTDHGDTSLAGRLTNLTAYYPFFNLPDATPSVVEALNTINAQIGNRDYTGGILTDGQTIAQSLQALANTISTGTVVRTIERLAADITANTAHTLPGGMTYTQDGYNNGRYLWVFTRGVLRDPGPVSTNNDYAETSPSSITFYAKQKKNDHINYFKVG